MSVLVKILVKDVFLTSSSLQTVGNSAQGLLRAIYTVRLCRMRQAYERLTTRIVSCKSNLQLAYDCRVRHKKSRRILKHVSKFYDNRRYRQCRMTRVVCDVLHDASSARSRNRMRQS